MTNGHGLRQRRFPERKKLVRLSLKPRYQRPERQSTLTQLNYVIPSSSGRDGSDLSEMDDDEYVESTSRKRRKTDSSISDRREKQSTLTQWEWLEQCRFSDDADDSDEHEVELVQDETDDELQIANQPTSTPPETENLDGRAIVNPGETFKTPKKPIKSEIPSSQSPAATPISSQQTPSTPLSSRSCNLPISNPPMSPLQTRWKHSGAGCENSRKQKFSQHDLSPSHERKTKKVSNSCQSGHNSTNIRPPMEHISHIEAKPTKTYDPTRSSQATTVDWTQPSPTKTRKQQSNLHGDAKQHLTPSSPVLSESYLPFALSSDMNIPNSTPSLPPPLENTQDLVTVSQLLPESMRGDV